jgi:hypothetical protein
MLQRPRASSGRPCEQATPAAAAALPTHPPRREQPPDPYRLPLASSSNPTTAAAPCFLSAPPPRDVAGPSPLLCPQSAGRSPPLVPLKGEGPIRTLMLATSTMLCCPSFVIDPLQFHYWWTVLFIGKVEMEECKTLTPEPCHHQSIPPNPSVHVRCTDMRLLLVNPHGSTRSVHARDFLCCFLLMWFLIQCSESCR